MRVFILVFVLLVATSSSEVFGQSILDAVPNPFDVSTELRIYNLSEDTVSLKVLNLSGAVVADFFNDLVLSGDLNVTFNGDTLPNGVYLVRLEKNGEEYGRSIIKNQAATAIQDVENHQSEILVFPNPMLDVLTISTDIKFNSILLFTNTGKFVLQSDHGSSQLNVQNLESGNYLLHVVAEDMTYIKKVIKL